MKKIIEIVVNMIGSNMTKVLCSALDTAKSFFSYKKTHIQNQEIERQQKIQEEFNKKVDKITKDGTLDDLLDLKRK